MKLQLIRHSTLILNINNKKILIDPMLSPKGLMDPIPDVPNQSQNPLVDLPINIDDIINCDAVLLTHTHRDHFDDVAAELLSKDIPMFCQPEDEEKLIALGFNDVRPVSHTCSFDEITITRTKGKHGHGIIAMKMAPVSGYVITCKDEPSVYVAGDTVWCCEVKKVMYTYKPEIIVCNSGSAQFKVGRPITMNSSDLHKLSKKYPSTTVVAVHMEAWNHCRISRKALKNFISTKEIKSKIYIPDDGEILSF